MSAPRDCNCFLSENFFVDAIGPHGRVLRWHFSYDGTDEIILEQLETLGLVDDGALSNDEFNSLKAALESERQRRLTLDEDRKRKKIACTSIMKGRRLNESAYTFNNTWLDKRCRAAIDVATNKKDASPEDIINACGGCELLEGRIYALPVLSIEACQRLDVELQHFSKVCADIKGRPNSMNKHGVLLDEAGMTVGVTDPLLKTVIAPLSKVLFDPIQFFAAPKASSKALSRLCSTLDHHHAFTVDYKCDSHSAVHHDRELAVHFDNSEVTLNVLISANDFDGGELAFEGGSHASPRSFGPLVRGPLRYEHKLGWGVLHLGSELHRALPIEDGTRRNLIAWCRSARYRLEKGCSMCGSKDQLVAPVLQHYLRS